MANHENVETRKKKGGESGEQSSLKVYSVIASVCVCVCGASDASPTRQASARVSHRYYY